MWENSHERNLGYRIQRTQHCWHGRTSSFFALCPRGLHFVFCIAASSCIASPKARACIASPPLQVAEEQFFCELTDDWERVITFHITQTQDCAAAVDVLTRRCTEAKHEPLWYQFSPTLMQHHPDRLVQGWMTEPPARFLNPSKLVPALVKYDPRLHNPPAVTENQVIVYLQWVIAKRRSADPVMHNLLLSLYARQPDGAVLLQFLQGSQHYDKKYALRLCIDAGKTLACVHIYSQMEMYEDAVATALKVPDLALAKANAEKPVDDPQLKKRLWLEIAKYVMQGQSNMKEAIDLLKVRALQGPGQRTPQRGRPDCAQGCTRREEASEAVPETVGQAVGGGCQSGWGRLLSVTNAIKAGAWREGDSGRA